MFSLSFTDLYRFESKDNDVSDQSKETALKRDIGNEKSSDMVNQIEIIVTSTLIE